MKGKSIARVRAGQKYYFHGEQVTVAEIISDKLRPWDMPLSVRGNYKDDMVVLRNSSGIKTSPLKWKSIRKKLCILDTGNYDPRTGYHYGQRRYPWEF